MTGLIDAHVHVWDIERMRISWFRDDLDLPRTPSLERLQLVADDAGIPLAGVIAVQAADTVEEARWLVELQAEREILPGVVLQYAPTRDRAGWAGAVQSLLEGPSAGAVRGIRLAHPAGAADLGDVPDLELLAAGLASTGRVLELLLRAEQLPAASRLAERHPDLPIVVCHLAIGGEEPDAAWQEDLRRFAAAGRTFAKVSGLVRDGDGDDDRVQRIVASGLDVFGPARLMFGSDWPMSARFSPYGDVVRRIGAAVGPLAASDEDRFWAGTAADVYGLAAAGGRSVQQGSGRV